MKASDIREQARLEIKNHIVYEGKYLYNLLHGKFPDFEKDKEWVIKFSEILPEWEEVKVTLEVFYDEECTCPQLFKLDSVHITLDDNLYFWDDDNEEHHYGELKVDELADLSNIIEEAVLLKIHEKYTSNK